MIYVVENNSIDGYMDAINLYKKDFSEDNIIKKREVGYSFAKNFLSEEIIVKKTMNIYKNLV